MLTFLKSFDVDVLKRLPMPPIFFVHVPKTAGTSFRIAIEQCLGTDAVLYDYSEMSEETSSLVRQWVYETPDVFHFYQQANQINTAFLCGHVKAAKFVHLVGVGQTVTFLRDPLQRLVSDYRHYVRHYQYQGDFPAFYRSPAFINCQSKMLRGVPLAALGGLGLSEHYALSLEVFNERFNLKVPVVEMNMNRHSIGETYRLPEAQRDELLALNADDLALYQRAKGVFDQRLMMFSQGLPYAHGDIQELTRQVITGWAWWAKGRESAVAVAIMLNGRRVALLSAHDFRPGLLRLLPPRRGHVGFRHVFKTPLPPGATVQAVVVETGQLLGESVAPADALPASKG